MDDLRYEMYYQSKVSDLHSLPPTSADLQFAHSEVHVHNLYTVFKT